MKKITPDDLEEGMVLAQPLVDSLGRVLLDKGETLKLLYIKKLKVWRIEEIFVEDSEKEGGTGIPEQAGLELADKQLTREIARIDKAIDAKFEGIEDSQMLSIRRAARDFLVERLTARYAPGTGKEERFS